MITRIALTYRESCRVRRHISVQSVGVYRFSDLLLLPFVVVVCWKKRTLYIQKEWIGRETFECVCVCVCVWTRIGLRECVCVDVTLCCVCVRERQRERGGGSEMASMWQRPSSSRQKKNAAAAAAAAAPGRDGGGGGIDEALLIDKMRRVDASSNAIQTLSHWCLFYEAYAPLIVRQWELELDRSKTSGARQLALLYLANDILQNCRNKGKTAFIDGFWVVMPRCLAGVLARADDSMRQTGSDEGVRMRVERLVKIWIERRVFGNTTQASELTRCLHLDQAQHAKDDVKTKKQQQQEEEADEDEENDNDNDDDDGQDNTAAAAATLAQDNVIQGAIPSSPKRRQMDVAHLVDAVANAQAQGASILKRAREDAAVGPSGGADAEKLAVASPQYKAVVAKEVEARKALVAELEKQLVEQRTALSALIDGDNNNTAEEEAEDVKRRRVMTDGDGNA